MIPSPAIQIALALDRAAERTMAKKPTPLPKGYEVKDGKIVKKATYRSASHRIAAKKNPKRKWSAVK